MGTIIDITIEQEEPADAIFSEVMRRLKVYEHRFSANASDSELMAVNQQAGIRPVSVHPELYDLIKIGKEHSCAPKSHLNIAIGPLVQTWRIGFEDARVPSEQEIGKQLEKIDPHTIILNDAEKTVFLKQPGMLIDLGALAKGYIADLLIAYLKEMKVRSALVNLGGNILGYKQEGDWKVGIQNPLLERDQYVKVLKVKDHSVVTSGIYERQLQAKGKTYHHILDPQTGYPTTTDVASLTIYSKRSLDGEVWTTRLYGRTSEEIISEIEPLAGIEGLVITKDGKMLQSKGL